MIIAIAIQENIANPRLQVQFGRCLWFAIYNSSSDQMTFLENTEKDNQKDAGISTASLLVSAGVSKVVAGRFGMKAADYLRDKNVQMIVPHKEDMTLDFILEMINPQRGRRMNENQD